MSAHKPILLSTQSTYRTTDDAGTTVIKSVLPSASACVGPYAIKPSIKAPRPCRVPSLVAMSVKALVKYPEELYKLYDWRSGYVPNTISSKDVIRVLTEHRGNWDDIDWSMVDPRLWAVIVQVFNNLPHQFKTLHLPLSDPYLPLLQGIPSTPQFTLITILVLTQANQTRLVNDNNITELRSLHNLCYLDISHNSISPHGLRRFAGTLHANGSTVPPRGEGPWSLRVLKLVDCRQINNAAFEHMVKFPLLCLVDVRKTACLPYDGCFHGFETCPYTKFTGNHEPRSLLDDLATLAPSSSFYSSDSPYAVLVTQLAHAAVPIAKRAKAVRQENTIVTFNSPQGSVDKSTLRVANVKAEPVFLDDLQRSRQGQPTARREKLVIPSAGNEEDYVENDHPGYWSESDQDNSGGDNKDEHISSLADLDKKANSLQPSRRIAVSSSARPVVRNVRAYARPSLASQTGSSFVSTNSFYPTKPPSPPPLPLDQTPLIKDPTNSDPQVLFRVPPPYSALDEHITRLLSAQSEAPRQHSLQISSAHLVPGEASKAAAAKHMTGLNNMINKRRKVDGSAAAITREAKPTMQAQNPFRRKSSSFASPLHMSALQMQSPGAGPSTLKSTRPRASLPDFTSDFPLPPAQDGMAASSKSSSKSSSGTALTPASGFVLPSTSAPSASSPVTHPSSIIEDDVEVDGETLNHVEHRKSSLPKPARPNKPLHSISALRQPEAQDFIKLMSKTSLRAPKPKGPSMTQARLDLQKSFAKAPDASAAPSTAPVLVAPDSALTHTTKRPRVDSAPTKPPDILARSREVLKPSDKPLQVIRARTQSLPSIKQPKGKDKKLVGPKVKEQSSSINKEKQVFNWGGWSKQ